MWLCSCGALNCSLVREIFPDKGPNPWPMHWQADPYPLYPQEVLNDIFKGHVGCGPILSCAALSWLLQVTNQVITTFAPEHSKWRNPTPPHPPIYHDNQKIPPWISKTSPRGKYLLLLITPQAILLLAWGVRPNALPGLTVWFHFIMPMSIHLLKNIFIYFWLQQVLAVARRWGS